MELVARLLVDLLPFVLGQAHALLAVRVAGREDLADLLGCDGRRWSRRSGCRHRWRLGGIRNLDRLAKLLPEPSKLLNAIGIAPISGQVLYPRIIEILDYFLTLLAFFALSAWIPLGIELGRELFQLDNWISFLIVNAIFSALTLVIIFLARRALIRREGRLASLRWLIASLFFIGLIVFIQAFYLLANIAAATALAIPIPASDDLRGSVSMFMPCSCTLGMLMIGFLSLWNWQDLIRWFPSR